MSNAEINAKIGRVYYQSLTDAAGYPNGMAYWEEMKPSDKYHYTVTALDFLRLAEKMEIIAPKKPYGIEPTDINEVAKFGEGECKELMDHFVSTQEADLASFNERLARFNEKLNKK